jgi:hypothetical protein
MSWAPNDLVTDADLLGYDERILTQFGQIAWAVRRSKALEDWLWPQLRVAGFDPQRFRTRFVADAVLGYTSAAYTDYTAAAASETASDVPLATVLASGSDALYVGSTAPFRGLSIRMTDSVASASRTLTVAVWADAWHGVAATDGTQATSGIPFSRGGAITWVVPGTLVTRTLNAVGPYYWAKLALSGAPTGAALGQVACIRRSLLCGPAALRTLALIYREAPLAQDGPWEAKAAWAEAEADKALERVLPVLGGEFDTITHDDVLGADEAGQTADAARGMPMFSLDRM